MATVSKKTYDAAIAAGIYDTKTHRYSVRQDVKTGGPIVERVPKKALGTTAALGAWERVTSRKK